MVADKSNGFSSSVQQSSQMASSSSSSFVSRPGSSRRSLPPKTSTSGGRASQGRTANFYESSSTIEGGASSHYNGGVAGQGTGGAPAFGHIRITQSTERDASLGNGIDGVDYSIDHHNHRQRSPYVSRRSSVSSAYAASPAPSSSTAARHVLLGNRSTSPSQRRRYSFTADRIFAQDRTVKLDDEDLNLETSEYLKGSTRVRPRSSLSYTPHKVGDRNHHFSSSGKASPSDYHRVPSYPSHSNQDEDDLDIRTSQFSKRVAGVHPRSSLNYMHKVGDRNHFTSSGDTSPDPYGQTSYMSPYRRVPSMTQPATSSGDWQSSTQYRSLSQSRQSRANSMPRVQTVESLRQNRQEETSVHEARPYHQTNVRARSVSRIGVGRGASLEPHDQTIDFDDDGGNTDSFTLRRQRRVAQKHVSRAASMSRMTDHHIGGAQIHYAPRYSVASIASNNASSSSRTTSSHVNHSGGGASAFVSGGSSRVTETTLYGGPDGSLTDETDITKYVFTPGEKFLPTDVSVSVLPSGKKAVTYTRFSQKGSGDQREANAEIDRIVAKTKLLQDSMHTLEDFVKRNRSLFPEDIIIYQRIVFYLLSEEELKRIGYSADAEVYGVKIREKLVAPHGTDVASILKRFYSKHKEVDVEYEERETIRRRLAAVDAEAAQEEASRRRTTRHTTTRVETEWEEEEELRRRRRDLKEQRDRYIDEEEEVVVTRRPPTRRRGGESPEPPQFTSRLRPRRIDVGESIKLTCSTVGFPAPVITWYLNGRQIINGLRFKIDNSQAGSSSLCIRNAHHEDGGTYTARAVNAEGEVSCTTTLTVEEDELARRKDALRRPWFIREPHNTTTQVGQRIILEAQATGKPLPTFKWQKNNVDITEDVDHVRIVTDSEGITKLILRDVRLSDAGQYVCIAENEAGRIASNASLRVGEAFDLTEYYTLDEFQSGGQRQPFPAPHRRGDSSVPSTLPFEIDELIIKHWNHPADFSLFAPSHPAEGRPEERGRKPHFVQVPPIEITVNEGDPVTLRCIVEGEPKPLVKWYKNVRELTYSGRHRVLAERNDHYMMQIRQTMQTDAGEYTIVAVNACGMIKYNLFINVIPREPEEPDSWSRPSFTTPKEVDLIPRREQGKMAPVFIKRLPREKELIVGGTLELECHIEEAKMKEYLVGYDIVVKGNQESKGESSIPSSHEEPSNVKIVKETPKKEPLLQTTATDHVQAAAEHIENEPQSAKTPTLAQVQPPVIENVPTDSDISKSQQALQDFPRATPADDFVPVTLAADQAVLEASTREADSVEVGEEIQEPTKRSSKSKKKRDKQAQQEVTEPEPALDSEANNVKTDDQPADISQPIVETISVENITEKLPASTSDTVALPIEDITIVQPVVETQSDAVALPIEDITIIVQPIVETPEEQVSETAVEEVSPAVEQDVIVPAKKEKVKKQSKKMDASASVDDGVKSVVKSSLQPESHDDLENVEQLQDTVQAIAGSGVLRGENTTPRMPQVEYTAPEQSEPITDTSSSNDIVQEILATVEEIPVIESGSVASYSAADVSETIDLIPPTDHVVISQSDSCENIQLSKFTSLDEPGETVQAVSLDTNAASRLASAEMSSPVEQVEPPPAATGIHTEEHVELSNVVPESVNEDEGRSDQQDVSSEVKVEQAVSAEVTSVDEVQPENAGFDVTKDTVAEELPSVSAATLSRNPEPPTTANVIPEINVTFEEEEASGDSSEDESVESQSESSDSDH